MDDETIEDVETEESSPIRQLRERAKRTDAAEAALAQANKRIAMLESGIDLTTPVGELFAKVYDGEATTDAVKAEAEKYGVQITR